MIFFPEASAEQGIEELRKATTQENFAQFEAAYYLGDIYLKADRIGEGLALQRWLYQQCPNNTWFAMEYGRALVDHGKLEEAEVLLSQQVKQFEQLLWIHTTKYCNHREPLHYLPNEQGVPMAGKGTSHAK